MYLPCIPHVSCFCWLIRPLLLYISLSNIYPHFPSLTIRQKSPLTFLALKNLQPLRQSEGHETPFDGLLQSRWLGNSGHFKGHLGTSWDGHLGGALMGTPLVFSLDNGMVDINHLYHWKIGILTTNIIGKLMVIMIFAYLWLVGVYHGLPNKNEKGADFHSDFVQ